MSEYICEIDPDERSIRVREKIVRCEDCQYSFSSADMFHGPDLYCDVMQADVYPDGYCFLGGANER